MDIPKEVKRIIEELEASGHEAYAVGGCVRDRLLGRQPSDWDITTSATPQEIKAVFHRTIDTGIAHGTVTVRMNHKSFEVTTYRIDGAYSDARHPDSVEFTDKLKEDLKRRDFTINAMAYHPVRGLVDLFGGEEDLKNGVIRCVGAAEERFSEDALRMMRAVRFGAQLGFVIEEDTYEAIRKLHEKLKHVSIERIRDEMTKLLLSGHPEHMERLVDCGLSGIFFPELDALFATPQHTVHHFGNVGEHTMAVLAACEPERVLRLAALFHDIAKPVCKKTDKDGVDHFVGHPQAGERMTQDLMRRMRFDNDTIRAVKALVCHHDERPKPSMRNVRRLAARVGAERMEELLALKRADVEGQSDHLRQEKMAYVEELEEYYNKIKEKEQCFTAKALSVNGRDLIEAGIPKGPEVGKILNLLLKKVIDDPECNQKVILLEEAKRLGGLLRCLAVVLLCGAALFFEGCSFSQSGTDDGPAERLDPVTPGDPAAERQEYLAYGDREGGDIYLIVSFNSKEEHLILQSMTTGRRYRYDYDLSTRFYNKYDHLTPQTDFKPGAAVTLDEFTEDGKISAIRLYGETWTVENMKNYTIKEEDGQFLIGNTKYRIMPDTLVFSGKVAAELKDIEEGDVLRVVGIDRRILSVTVTTGHGYLALINTKTFDGSLISIGTKIYAVIQGEATIEVPEGTYDVTVANNGYGGTAKVKIGRNETVSLDLNTLKGEGPKKCRITFKVAVKSAKIFLDGKQVDPGKEIEVVYGKHDLRVEADGYEPWEKTLFANSPSAEIELALSEEESAKKNDSSEKESKKEEDKKEEKKDEDDEEEDEDDDEDEKQQAELDYLTTLSDMISSLTNTD